MTAACEISADKALKVLIFSLDRRRMGTCADNVSAVIDRKTAERRGMRLISLAGLLGMAYEDESAPDMRERTVLIISNSDPSIGILIDQLDEISDIAPTDILPMPRSIVNCEGMGPYIGGMLKDKEIVLMLDMQKIASIKETA